MQKVACGGLAVPQAAQEREVVVILRPLYNTRTRYEITVPVVRNV